MENKKLISKIGIINRGLGMIIGFSYFCESNQARALLDAVRMIEDAIEEVTEDENNA